MFCLYTALVFRLAGTLKFLARMRTIRILPILDIHAVFLISRKTTSQSIEDINEWLTLLVWLVSCCRNFV